MIERQSIVNAIDLAREGDDSLLNALDRRLTAGEELEGARRSNELIAHLRQHHRAIVEQAQEDLDNYGALGQANSQLEMILDEWNEVRDRLDAEAERGHDPFQNDDLFRMAIRVSMLLRGLNARCSLSGDLRVRMVVREMDARNVPVNDALREPAFTINEDGLYHILLAYRRLRRMGDADSNSLTPLIERMCASEMGQRLGWEANPGADDDEQR